MSDHPVLGVEKVGVSLVDRGRALPMVTDLSLQIEPGQAYGIIGESGSGKSISCYALLGLLDSRWRVSGEAWLNGTPLPLTDHKAMARLRGDRLSLVMQNPMSAFDSLYTIAHHFLETAHAHLRVSDAQTLKRAAELLERMRIRDPKRVLKSYPFECSGGMLQRVMIAIAILGKPDVLIADEPTTALDQPVQYEIVQLLQELKQAGTSVLIVSHDLKIISGLADHIGVMYGGYLVESMPTARMIAGEAEHPYTRGLLRARPTFSKDTLFSLPGSPPSLAQRRGGCPFAARCPLDSSECGTFDMTQDDLGPDHRIRCRQVMTR